MAIIRQAPSKEPNKKHCISVLITLKKFNGNFYYLTMLQQI